MTARMQRWVGITGIVFVVLVVASVFAGGDSPDTSASAAKVVRYYHDHKDSTYVESYLIVLAVIVGTGFFWYLREFLVSTAQNTRLAMLGFAGALVFTISGAVQAGATWMLADGAHHHLTGVVMQTLNIFSEDFSELLGTPGVVLLFGATGILLIRNHAPFPQWAGWVSIVLAIISIIPGIWAGLPALGIFVLVFSILLIARAGRVPAALATAAEPSPLPVGA